MRQKIESQEWPYGSQIPTLDELEREYAVSRITLRAALTQLEESGIVRRTRGLGTFVTKDLSEQRWFKLPNSMAELERSVSHLTARQVERDKVVRSVPNIFNVGEAAASYQYLRRVHVHQGQPFCFIDLYVEKSIFDDEAKAMRAAPVMPLILRHPRVKVGQAKQVMRITMCDDALAAHLNIGVGEPICDVCRIIVGTDNRIVYYAHIQYVAELIQVETDLMGTGTKRSAKKKAKATAGSATGSHRNEVIKIRSE